MARTKITKIDLPDGRQADLTHLLGARLLAEFSERWGPQDMAEKKAFQQDLMRTMTGLQSLFDAHCQLGEDEEEED